MERNLLLPDEDAHSAPFWEACREQRLTIQRCAACGQLRFPPRPMCPACNSLEHEWVDAAGTGTIWSFVVVHPPVLPAYNDLAPYPVAVIQLAEDPILRMVGNVVAEAGAKVNSVDPAELSIGAPVRVVFEDLGEAALPRWVLE
jgi:uncharacterized OB-fold protein